MSASNLAANRAAAFAVVHTGLGDAAFGVLPTSLRAAAFWVVHTSVRPAALLVVHTGSGQQLFLWPTLVSGQQLLSGWSMYESVSPGHHGQSSSIWISVPQSRILLMTVICGGPVGNEC